MADLRMIRARRKRTMPGELAAGSVARVRRSGAHTGRPGEYKVAVSAATRPYLVAFRNSTGAYSPYDVAVCGLEVTYTMPPEA